MNKHTPGPWTYTVGADDDETRCIVHQKDATRDWIIAVIENGAPGDSLDTEKANASLIAASPELYGACKAANRAIHALVAIAYTICADLKGTQCNECGCISPRNGEDNSFKITHDDDCRTMAAVRAEWMLDAAIAKAEGRQS